ncbi:MFS transporter [Mitsuokella sp. AF33-22]|uniref:MFS transporter n=1 Tax=Mitsuokella sp. AF33-22 TaxID=2292047 RepID=UPI000E4E4D73|nr:MFS transporter [Mitsuokella sp. AF33-22]RHM53016.1 MFS transporter [Mitsuokella sp. AF33-22]RHM53136.1 MFS transporter [Mitsuokella sp. AF33-22]
MERERLWTPEFLGMGGSNLFLFMSQYIMVAALPIFIMDSLGGGDMEAGLAMSFFQIGAVTCRPLAGRLIDAVNKRRLMIAATTVFFLIMLAFNWLHSLTSIYVLRLLHGCIFALATTAAAAMAALVLPATRKGEGIGYFALSTNLAMVVGPLLGLLLIGNLGSTALFAFVTLLGALTFFAANARRLPDAIILPAKRTKKGFHLSDFIERKALAPAGLGGLVFFAYGGILTFIPLYAKSLGLQAETSLFFMVFALVIILTRPVIGRLFDEKGPDWTVWPGFLFFAAGMVIFSQVQSVTGLLIAAAVLGIGFGALSPAFQTLAVKSAAPSRAGVATATYFWSLDISVGLAAAIMSIVAANFGYPFMYGAVNTAIVILTAVCYYIWRRHQKRIAHIRRAKRKRRANADLPRVR